MAYQSNELFSEVERKAFPRVHPKMTKVGTIGSIVGAPTLKRLTPMAFNTATNKWAVWTNGGANGTGTIKAFLWPGPGEDEVKTSAADDTHAVLLIEGEIEYADIALPTGELDANLKTACRSGPRDLGLHIRGLDQVR